MKHKVSEVTLPSGAAGLLIHVPDASVMNFEFNFRAGEYLVDRDKWETPHLMEHLMMGANESHRKARTFQEEFEKNGAYCNASTGAYDITYEAECADFEWDRILDLIGTAMSRPLFLEEEFKAEYGNVREELMARSNGHFRHLSLALREAFGFYAMTDHERLRLIENVNLPDIKAHYKSTHTLQNLRFVIAGKITPKRRKFIKQYLENLELAPGDTRLELPHEVPRTLTKPLVIKNKTVENLYFYIDTFMNRRMRDPEQDALSLINMMFTETLYSRILGNARERGLAYHVSSGYGQTRDSSNWWIGAQIMPQNAEALYDIIARELRKVFRGDLHDDDVTAAKQYALGRYQRSGQTVAGIAGSYSGRYFFDGEIEDFYSVPDRIRAVSKNRIVAITEAMFADNVWGMGLLGNASERTAADLHKKVGKLF
ncbi:MAG: pitrilysin family protein [Candidatus Saccharibacteria bacterium]|nr:pitrilysin family protein [Candidatus Saccharibacteria bacterium]